MGRPNLSGHRKFRRLARVLRSDALARGSLELIWESCYESGEPYLGDSDDVEAAARWDGEPGILTKALLEAGGEGNAGFIEALEDHPGHFRVHDLFDHAPDYVAGRRERELERQRKGITLSQIRSEAGRKGAAVSNAGRKTKHVGQEAGLDGTANDSQTSASVRQFASTPAPARTPPPTPAPSPAPSFEQENCSNGNQPFSSEQKSCSDKERLGTPSKVPSEEAKRLAELLKSEILRNKPDYRITKTQLRKWAVTAERMIRLDGRSETRVAEIIRWVQQDQFWMANVLSMDTLREKFDQLELKRTMRHSKHGRKDPKHEHSGFEQKDYTAGLQPDGNGGYRF